MVNSQIEAIKRDANVGPSDVNIMFADEKTPSTRGLSMTGLT
jgi:hypothetical protein